MSQTLLHDPTSIPEAMNRLSDANWEELFQLYSGTVQHYKKFKTVTFVQVIDGSITEPLELVVPTKDTTGIRLHSAIEFTASYMDYNAQSQYAPVKGVKKELHAIDFHVLHPVAPSQKREKKVVSTVPNRVSAKVRAQDRALAHENKVPNSVYTIHNKSTLNDVRSPEKRFRLVLYQQAMKLQHTLTMATHAFLDSRGFTHIHQQPKSYPHSVLSDMDMQRLSRTQTYNGSMSMNQIYGRMHSHGNSLLNSAVMCMDRCYSIFYDQSSNTIEIGVTYVHMGQLMDLMEDFTRALIQHVYGESPHILAAIQRSTEADTSTLWSAFNGDTRLNRVDCHKNDELFEGSEPRILYNGEHRWRQDDDVVKCGPVEIGKPDTLQIATIVVPGHRALCHGYILEERNDRCDRASKPRATIIFNMENLVSCMTGLPWCDLVTGNTSIW